MSKKPATKAERLHMERVAALGCIVDGCCAPATIHHPRFAAGMAQRSPHMLCIPLCKYHHQDGGYGQAIHAGQQAFEQNHGTEADLLAKTITKLQGYSA